MKKLRFLSLLSFFCSFAALPSQMQAAPSSLKTLCAAAAVMATTTHGRYWIDAETNSWVRSYTAPDTGRYWAEDLARADNGDILTVGPYANDSSAISRFTHNGHPRDAKCYEGILFNQVATTYGEDFYAMGDVAFTDSNGTSYGTFLGKLDDETRFHFGEVLAAGLAQQMNKMVVTEDGGLLMTGNVVAPFDASNPFLSFFANPFGANQHSLVVRTNPQGIPQWATTLAFSDYDEGIDVVPTSDGGFVSLGCSIYFTTKALTLTKFNHVDNGTVVDWSKMYLLPFNDTMEAAINETVNGTVPLFSNTSALVPTRIIETKDEELVVAGIRVAFDLSVNSTSGDMYGMFIAKFTKEGELLWFTGVRGNNDITAFTLNELKNGDYFVAGSYYPDIFSYHVMLSVFDKDEGELKRMRSYSDEDYNATIAFASFVQNDRVYVAGGLAPETNITAETDINLMLAQWPQALEGCARNKKVRNEKNRGDDDLDVYVKRYKGLVGWDVPEVNITRAADGMVVYPTYIFNLPIVPNEIDICNFTQERETLCHDHNEDYSRMEYDMIIWFPVAFGTPILIAVTILLYCACKKGWWICGTCKDKCCPNAC